MVIMLAFYLFIMLAENKNKYLKLTSIPLFAGIIYLQLILAMTYSRGGYVALLAGIVVLYWLTGKKYCFLLAGAFIFSLVYTSAGIQRLSSISNIGQGSIYNRLLLWHGGTGIIAKNYLHGMDYKQVGRTYTAWYQPLWLNERYGGLISDYFNIAVSYGIFAFCGYLILIYMLTWLTYRIAYKNGNLLCGILFTVIITYLISSVFSTLFMFINVYGLFLTVLGIALITVAWNLFRRNYQLNKLDFAVPIVASVFISSAILIYGSIVNSSKSFTYEDIKENNTRIVKAIPQTTPKALIVYVFNTQKTSYTSAIRSNVRPLVKLGYEVWAIGVDSGFNGQKNLSGFIKNINKDFFLFGNEDGGKQAIIAAANSSNSNLSGVIAVNSPAEWPFDELSPIKYINKVKVPTLLISTYIDSYYESLQLYKTSKYNDLQHLNISKQKQSNEATASIALNKLSSFIDQVVNAPNMCKTQTISQNNIFID